MLCAEKEGRKFYDAAFLPARGATDSRPGDTLTEPSYRLPCFFTSQDPSPRLACLALLAFAPSPSHTLAFPRIASLEVADCLRAATTRRRIVLDLGVAARAGGWAGRIQRAARVIAAGVVALAADGGAHLGRYATGAGAGCRVEPTAGSRGRVGELANVRRALARNPFGGRERSDGIGRYGGCDDFPNGHHGDVAVRSGSRAAGCEAVGLISK